MHFGTFTNPLASLFGNLGQSIGTPTTGLQTLFPQTNLLGGLFQNLGLQSLTPTTTFPTTTFGGLQCFTGRVNILVFIRPSNIVATLTTNSGQTILLTTNSAIVRNQLAQVDNQFATVCGTFVIRDNRLALNVQAVIPQQVIPPVNLQQLLLLLLLLLLIRGRLPVTTLGTTGLGSLVDQFGGITGLQQTLTQMGGVTGVTNLVNQLGGEAAITSQLQQAGITI